MKRKHMTKSIRWLKNAYFQEKTHARLPKTYNLVDENTSSTILNPNSSLDSLATRPLCGAGTGKIGECTSLGIMSL